MRSMCSRSTKAPADRLATALPEIEKARGGDHEPDIERERTRFRPAHRPTRPRTPARRRRRPRRRRLSRARLRSPPPGERGAWPRSAWEFHARAGTALSARASPPSRTPGAHAPRRMIGRIGSRHWSGTCSSARCARHSPSTPASRRALFSTSLIEGDAPPGALWRAARRCGAAGIARSECLRSCRGECADHPMSAVTLGPAGSRVGLNTHRGFTKPAFHWPMFSLGLLVFESMWPPASWTAASLPLLNGT